MQYEIFCKYHQAWLKYDITIYECQESGMGNELFLRCHLCNNYWISIDPIDGIRDKIRNGYEVGLIKEQIKAKPLFRFKA